MSEGATPLLRVADLKVHFRTGAGMARAVDGVDFTVDAGRVVGLVGESGCGKSVTALAMLGLLPRAGVTRSGRAEWHGRNLLAASEAEMRTLRGRAISMIFQDPAASLNPVFTVGDQIFEVLRLHLGMTKTQARGRAADALAEVGLERPRELLKSYPGQLSGGMRQRVMIAMALATNPELLVADEPTTALDVTTQAQVLRLVHELRTRMGTAILFITHDLGVVAELCEEVVVLYGGRVAEAAPVSALFDAPLHPYTQGLLRVVRRLDEGGVEAAIPGRVPAATAYPTGCRFHPRCPHAMDACRAEHPPTVTRGATRVACWLHAERTGGQ